MFRDKPFFWGLMTLLLEALVIVTVVPSSFIDKINSMERKWIEATYSESSMRWLDEKTNEIHYKITRESGLVDWMTWMFIPSEEARAREGRGMARLGERLWFPYLESRGKALDDMLRGLITRLGSTAMWAPLILLIAIPSIWDGLVERRIKQHTFKYPSPFIYRHGMNALLVISFLLGVCFFSPVPIPPLVLPIGIMVIVAVGGIAVVGNMPKRL